MGEELRPIDEPALAPRLLTTPIAVHDVRDIEAHVRAILDSGLAELAARLDASLYEDAHSFLVARGLELGRGYDPTRGLSFSTYSRRILRLRLADWYRSTFGDARYDRAGRETSYDALTDRGEDADEYLDRRGPGARSDRIDELHRRADPLEDVVSRAALGL